MVLKVIAVSN